MFIITRLDVVKCETTIVRVDDNIKDAIQDLQNYIQSNRNVEDNIVLKKQDRIEVYNRGYFYGKILRYIYQILLYPNNNVGESNTINNLKDNINDDDPYSTTKDFNNI